MIAAILGWTKLPQWALELIVIALVAVSVWYWQHERFEAGIAAQVATDAAERAALVAANDKKTADLQMKATMAEQAYDKEHQANVDYQHDNPIGPIRLCIATQTGASHLPQARPANAGNAATGARPAEILSMPSGDSSGGSRTAGPDIGTMLAALAVAADDVSGVLREYQNRE